MADAAPRATARIFFGTLARLALGVGLLVVLLWVLAPDWAALAARATFDPSAAALALIATTAATWVTARRWQLLAEALGGPALPFAVYFHHMALTRLLGQLSSTLVMDLLGRPLALRGAGDRRAVGHLVMPLLLERGLDLLIPLALIGWALLARDLGDLAAWLGFVATLVGSAVLGAPLLSPVAGLLVRVRLRGRGSTPGPAPALVPATVVRVAALGVARYAVVVVQFAAMGAAAGAWLPARVVASATAPAQITGLVGVTPGGLGIQDAGWAGALTWLGVDGTLAALFVLGTRALTLVNFAIVALLSRPALRRVAAASAAAPRP